MSHIANDSSALAHELNLPDRDDEVGSFDDERLVSSSLILFLALAALARVADFPTLHALVTALAAGLAIATVIRAAFGSRPRVMPIRPVAVALALVALAGMWMVVQMSPISPASWQHPLWALSAPALGDAGQRLVPRITLDPDAAADAVSALLRDVLVFWIAYDLAGKGAGARRLLTAVAIIGVIAALGSLIGRLGLASVPAGSGVAGLGMVALLAMWIERLCRPANAVPLVQSGRTNYARLIQAAPLAGVVAVAASIAAADGRDELLAALIGLLGILLAAMVAPGLTQFRRRAGMRLSLGTAFIAAALLVSVPIAIHRIGASSAPEGIATAAIAAQAIADAPLLGTGPGTSGAILRLYGAEGAAPGAFMAAAIELGIPAALALVLGCLALFSLSALGVWRRRRNVVYACAGIGATLLVASDAVVGPSLRDPAVSLIWCVLMGISCAQSLRSDERRAGAVALRNQPARAGVGPMSGERLPGS
jgi:hypothetical protein